MTVCKSLLISFLVKQFCTASGFCMVFFFDGLKMRKNINLSWKWYTGILWPKTTAFFATVKETLMLLVLQKANQRATVSASQMKRRSVMQLQRKQTKNLKLVPTSARRRRRGARIVSVLMENDFKCHHHWRHRPRTHIRTPPDDKHPAPQRRAPPPNRRARPLPSTLHCCFEVFQWPESADGLRSGWQDELPRGWPIPEHI